MKPKTTYINNSALKTIDPDFKGNVNINGKFFNSEEREHAPLLDVLKWKLSRNPQRKEKAAEIFCIKTEVMPDLLSSSNDVIVWLGHASFFIRLDGISLITDPSFHDVGYVKRLFPLPCQMADLPAIDYILVSHFHRDHFDLRSVKSILEHHPSLEFLLPLSSKTIMKNDKSLNTARYQEAAWFQQYETSGTITITFMPARHWNRRGLSDFNKSLWGSFVIKGKSKTILFAGDTGFSDHFLDIAKHFPAPDVCIMPIGAYKPSFLMQREHLSPAEAVKAFNILKGSMFIPMHYGTYDLSDEPMGEPIQYLKNLESTINGTLEILPPGKALNL